MTQDVLKRLVRSLSPPEQWCFLTCLVCCLSTMAGQELKHSADKDVRELSGSLQILCARGKVTEKREVAEMEIR